MILQSKIAFVILLVSFIVTSLLSAFTGIFRAGYLREFESCFLALGISGFASMLLIVAFPSFLGERIYSTIVMAFLLLPISLMSFFLYNLFRHLLVNDKVSLARLFFRSLTGSVISTVLIVCAILVAMNYFVGMRLDSSEASYAGAIEALDRIQVPSKPEVMGEIIEFREGIRSFESSSMFSFAEQAKNLCFGDACLDAVRVRAVDSMNTTINIMLLTGTVNELGKYGGENLGLYLPSIKPVVDALPVRPGPMCKEDMTYSELKSAFDELMARTNLAVYDKDSFFASSVASISMHTGAFRALILMAYNGFELQAAQTRSPDLFRVLYEKKDVQESDDSKALRYMILYGLSNLTVQPDSAKTL